MIAHRNFEGCQPLTWVGKVPVYLATVLAAAYGIAMALTAMAMAVGGGIPAANPLLSQLGFSAGDVFQGGRFWQFITYAFVNPVDLWTVIQLFLLAVFGRDVEKFIGRRAFGWFYFALVVAGPVLLSVLSLFGVNGVYYGAGTVNFAVFIAFVLIYPSADIFFGLQAKWLAAILLAVNTLQLIAGSAWPQLAVLWWLCGVAFFWMRREGVAAFSLPALPSLRGRLRHRPRLRVVKPEPEEEEGLHDSIDPILEKISRQGIESLTRAERERLEKARSALLQKERPH